MLADQQAQQCVAQMGIKKFAGRQGKWLEKKRRKCLQKS